MTNEKRPRGRRVGVKLMEVYKKDLKEDFDNAIEKCEKRLTIKRHKVNKEVLDKIGYVKVEKRIRTLLRLAKKRKQKSLELDEEAEGFKQQAMELSQELKISITIDRYWDFTSDSDDVEPSKEVSNFVDVVQKKEIEYLDLREVKYWSDYYQKAITKCITMEQCVGLLCEAEEKIQSLRSGISHG